MFTPVIAKSQALDLFRGRRRSQRTTPWRPSRLPHAVALEVRVELQDEGIHGEDLFPKLGGGVSHGLEAVLRGLPEGKFHLAAGPELPLVYGAQFNPAGLVLGNEIGTQSCGMNLDSFKPPIRRAASILDAEKP